MEEINRLRKVTNTFCYKNELKEFANRWTQSLFASVSYSTFCVSFTRGIWYPPPPPLLLLPLPDKSFEPVEKSTWIFLTDCKYILTINIKTWKKKKLDANMNYRLFLFPMLRTQGWIIYFFFSSSSPGYLFLLPPLIPINKDFVKE